MPRLWLRLFLKATGQKLGDKNTWFVGNLLDLGQLGVFSFCAQWTQSSEGYITLWTPAGYLVTWQGYGHCLKVLKHATALLKAYNASKKSETLPEYTNAVAKYACMSKILSYLDTGKGIQDGHTCLVPEPLSLGKAAAAKTWQNAQNANKDDYEADDWLQQKMRQLWTRSLGLQWNDQKHDFFLCFWVFKAFGYVSIYIYICIIYMCIHVRMILYIGIRSRQLIMHPLCTGILKGQLVLSFGSTPAQKAKSYIPLSFASTFFGTGFLSSWLSFAGWFPTSAVFAGEARICPANFGGVLIFVDGERFPEDSNQEVTVTCESVGVGESLFGLAVGVDKLKS